MKGWYFSTALELVVILGRHGIRSPLMTPAEMAAFAAQPWPEWPVAPGVLTPHGGRQMVVMGGYFRDRYLKEGLLSGQSAQDVDRIQFRSDSDQRTIESAERLAEGLLPGTAAVIHHRPQDAADPLFVPVRLDIGHPDRALAAAAIRGRIGDNPQALFEAHRPTFVRLQRILYGDEPIAPGKRPPLRQSAGLGPGTNTNLVALTGPLNQGLVMTDALLLEYAEGMPLSQVGWGRMTRADLTDLLSVHSLEFNLTQKTFYCAQAQGSNLARHLRETLDQAVSGRAVAGAIGTPAQRMLVVLGHDTNLVNFAGLLNLSWIIAGSQNDPVLPGGSLVLELRKGDDGAQRIRIYYVSQTLDGMRGGEAIDAAHPPAIAPVFIPGCSDSEPGYDAPLAKFEQRLEQAIDPTFVLPGSD